METVARVDNVASDGMSGVSWASIAAGAAAAAALSLALLAFGAGLGLSSISPWSDSGVSASTFKAASGVYLVIVAVMSSAIGGYLASRLRTKWVGLHTSEVFFRDTAHGFVAWAFATVVSAAFLGGAATHLVSGAAAGLGQGAAAAAQNAAPSQVYVDRLFRSDGGNAAPTPGTAGPNPDAARAEASRLWISSFREGTDIAPTDRTYLARLIASQTGMPQPDAERRVNEVTTQAKAAADTARKVRRSLPFG